MPRLGGRGGPGSVEAMWPGVWLQVTSRLRYGL